MNEDSNSPMTESDALLFEKLVEAGFDPNAVDGLDADQRARLDRMSSMLGLLDEYPTEPLEDHDRRTLVNATLARVDRFDDEQDDRMKFSNAEAQSSRPSFGAAELVAVAAIIILGLAVIFPIMNAGRQDATQQHSSQNLAMIGQGLFDYAASNNDTLPTTSVDEYAPVFGAAPERLDIQPLIEGEFIDKQAYSAGSSGGYSFQTQPTHHKFSLQGPSPTILLGDSNPTVEHFIIINLDQSRAAIQIKSQTKVSWSPNVLFADGHSEQLSSHIYQGDDLRLPSENWESLQQPDAFLTH